MAQLPLQTTTSDYQRIFCLPEDKYVKHPLFAKVGFRCANRLRQNDRAIETSERAKPQVRPFSSPHLMTATFVPGRTDVRSQYLHGHASSSASLALSGIWLQIVEAFFVFVDFFPPVISSLLKSNTPSSLWVNSPGSKTGLRHRKCTTGESTLQRWWRHLLLS